MFDEVFYTSDWDLVAQALGHGFSHCPSGLTPEGVEVAMATHSFGSRFFVMAPGHDKKTLHFVEEADIEGGWYLIGEKSPVRYIEVASATSGTLIAATKMADGTWRVTLIVTRDRRGRPYEGLYYKAFVRARALAGERSREAVSLDNPEVYDFWVERELACR